MPGDRSRRGRRRTRSRSPSSERSRRSLSPGYSQFSLSQESLNSLSQESLNSLSQRRSRSRSRSSCGSVARELSPPRTHEGPENKAEEVVMIYTL